MTHQPQAAATRAVWDKPDLIALNQRLDGVLNAGGTTSDAIFGSSTTVVVAS